MIKQWHILEPDPEKVEALRVALGCHPVTAAVLVNRGISSVDRAAALREASLKQLRTPFGLKSMDAAVERIARALAAGEKILVFGDYDVDGVTATAVLIEFLRAAGADVSYHIPDRRTEGYGLKAGHIEDLAVSGGIGLIVTADCGSSDHDAVAAAAGAGIDVVITDHHLMESAHPAATAVVNPQQVACGAGLEHLSGVGVAFYLVVALRKHLREMGFWQRRREPNLKRLCDLVALGTVADIVPLIGENRVFTRAGLELINADRRPGLASLREVAGLSARPLDAEDIAFRMAPRINAAGRIGHATTALELLLTDNRQKALNLARDLDEYNATRRRLEQDVVVDILARLKADPALLKKRVLVLADPRWHEGVLGIAASKIVNRFYRPAVLLRLSDEVGRGSARSIPDVDLFKCLKACSRWLENFGGHAQAAGLSLRAADIERFRDDLDAVLRRTARPNTFIPRLTLDAELDFADISSGLLDELETLKPFGSHYPEPLFASRAVTVTSSQIVGGRHRRMTLSQHGQGGGRIAAIHFSPDRRAAEADKFERIAFRLRRNVWNGRNRLQLMVEEVQTAAGPGND